MLDFETTVRQSPLMLTEGAVIESLRRSKKVALHPRLENALLIYETSGRAALSKIYDSYASIAIQADVPMAIFTPTWRANPERMAEARIGRNVNSDAVLFLKDLRESWNKEGQIFIGGLLGCKNDCYRPEEGLPAAAAQSFHWQQIQHLTEAGVDFLLAATLPSVPEARGIALSMESTELPYLISFVIDQQGFVLDGNSLERAFESIDTACRRPPLGYMINCAYPSFLKAQRLAPWTLSRLLGFQANASSMAQSDLDESVRLQADAVDDWGDRMIELYRRYGLKILGGCCGTGPAHLIYLARELGFRKNG